MNGERLDALQQDAELYAGSYTPPGLREFALQVIELCEAYGRSRAALEEVTKERDTLAAFANTETCKTLRCSKVVPQESE